VDQPRPEDFGLNDKQAAYFRSRQENRERFYKINGYSIAIIAGITLLLSFPFNGLFREIFAAILIAPIVGTVLGSLSMVLIGYRQERTKNSGSSTKKP
jgi:hypothetical protein